YDERRRPPTEEPVLPWTVTQLRVLGVRGGAENGTGVPLRGSTPVGLVWAGLTFRPRPCPTSPRSVGRAGGGGPVVGSGWAPAARPGPPRQGSAEADARSGR